MVPPEVQAALRKAIEQFNTRQFWECHETLEDVWIEEHGPLREFYHGLIQAAAGFVHVQRGNWYGAVRLLAGAHEKLVDFTPACLGVEVTALVDALGTWRRRLAAGGPDALPARDELAFPVLRFDDPAIPQA